MIFAKSDKDMPELCRKPLTFLAVSICAIGIDFVMPQDPAR